MNSTRPLTLAEQAASFGERQVQTRPGLIAYPFNWQEPAATEKTAYASVLSSPLPDDCEYVGFPWATLIDGLRNEAAVVPVLLSTLSMIGLQPRTRRRRVTVAQHIYAMHFAELMTSIGITDVLWSHAVHGQAQVRGMNIHPFPLFPAQTPAGASSEPLDRPRRHLASFIGAYNPRVYLTGVRAAIFEDAGREDDMLIIRREAWHFDRVVYDEQIRGLTPDEQRVEAERQHAQEYLESIRDSWFTLCPSGSGPNSIRVFESLCLGSIPIVLTRDLRLAGPQALWRRAALIEDDSDEGYRRSVATARAMPTEERMAMLDAGAQLLGYVAPSAYGSLIASALANPFDPML